MSCHRPPRRHRHPAAGLARRGLRATAAALLLFGCAPAVPPPATSGPAPAPRVAASGSADGFLVVDCLLPGQVRRLGDQVTFVTARRAQKTTARDCEIRGGEYVAYDRADYKTALKVWMEAAQQGDPKAQAYVGEIYEKGLGVAPDYGAAAQWYRRAAERGYAPAAFNLGVLYENGLGVPKDAKAAAEWYKRGSGSLSFDVGPGASGAQTRQLEAELERVRRELQAKQADLDSARRGLEEGRRSLDERQAEARTARAELERLRKERADLQGKDQSGAARSTALQQAIEESTARVRTKEREVSTLQERLTRVQDDANRQQADKDRELQSLRDRLARSEAEIQAQRAGLESLKRDRDQAGPEIELTQIQLVEPQGAGLTRDIKVQPTSGAGAGLTLLIAGRVRATGPVQSLSVNGREEVLDRDGVFKARIPVKGTQEERVRLVALDRSNRKGTLEMIVPGRVQVASTRGDGEGPRLTVPRAVLGNYHALVIGNNKYTKFSPLRTAVSDADAVAKILRERYGFKVRLLRDATRLQILSALNELREGLTEKDNLLIYYAGHGDLDQKNQRGYWLPVDAEPGNTANWISNVDVSDLLNLMAVKHLLVVADSCYAATLTRSAVGRLEPTMTQAELDRALQTLAGKRARMVMTSGGVEPVLDGTGGPHSVFAQVFLEILEGNDGVMRGSDLFRHLQLRVHALAQRWAVPQVPEYAPIKYAGHEGGDFFFLRAGT
jgi:Caspase domain/Sel1 repeat